MHSKGQAGFDLICDGTKTCLPSASSMFSLMFLSTERIDERQESTFTGVAVASTFNLAARAPWVRAMRRAAALCIVLFYLIIKLNLLSLLKPGKKISNDQINHRNVSKSS